MRTKKRSVTVRFTEQEYEKLESLLNVLERTGKVEFPSLSDGVRYAVDLTQRLERESYKSMKAQGYYEPDYLSKIVDEYNDMSHRPEGHGEDCFCDDCLPF